MINKDLKVKLRWHKDMWQVIKDETMTTISKDKGKYPDSEWKRRLLISEHSPIRMGRIIAKFYDIYSFVMGHFVRHHEGFEKFVSSRRADRGFEDEVIDRYTPVDMSFDGNFQSHINISRKRLCNNASPETREAWRLYLDEVVKPLEPELYSVCVRECVYRNGFCPEKFYCGFNKTPAFEIELKEYIKGMESQINPKTLID